jgi:hypothetical protein
MEDSSVQWSDTCSDISIPIYGKNKRYSESFREQDGIKIRRRIPSELRGMYEEDKKSVLVQVYETNTTPLFRIRNAVTGVYYPKFRVGTKDEERFYKVCWATGYKGRQSPIVMFFNTRHEFEKHMLIV